MKIMFSDWGIVVQQKHTDAPLPHDSSVVVLYKHVYYADNIN
jgi:hypothetical protein